MHLTPPQMLRKEAMVRAGLVEYYISLLNQNKYSYVDPVAYAGIHWAVAHMALEAVYNELDTIELRTLLLKNVVCFNKGLLTYLISRSNIFTY
jgi:hypothetical protein